MPKSIIDRDEEPRIFTTFDNRARTRGGETITVVNPGGFGRSAVLAGTVSGADRAGDCDAVHLGSDLLDRKRDRRIVQPDRQVHVVGFKPFAGNRRANVRLALMVRNQDLDWRAQYLTPDILDRHAGR